MVVKEGMARISLKKGVFFNPEMEVCRNVSSLCVGAIGEKISVLDGMCASGVRGIRYALENENVGKVAFVDANKEAIALAKKNAKANKVKKASFAESDFNKFVFARSFDFIELDPFGSPVPFLYHAVRSFRSLKRGYLSVTATDAAVLCGAHFAACLKNYQARPLPGVLCHEAASRILLAKIARTASEFNLGMTPLFTLSRQHFFKTVVRLEQGAEEAVNAIKQLGFMAHCAKCLSNEATKNPFAGEACKECGNKQREWAGPLWLGEIHSRETLEKMSELNAERKYGKRKEVFELLELMKGEIGFAPGFIDLHDLSRLRGKSPRKLSEVIKELEKKGFRAARTHFKATSLKTNAPAGEL